MYGDILTITDMIDASDLYDCFVTVVGLTHQNRRIYAAALSHLNLSTDISDSTELDKAAERIGESTQSNSSCVVM
jgi:hypothetical protein